MRGKKTGLGVPVSFSIGGASIGPRPESKPPGKAVVKPPVRPGGGLPSRAGGGLPSRAGSRLPSRTGSRPSATPKRPATPIRDSLESGSTTFAGPFGAVAPKGSRVLKQPGASSSTSISTPGGKEVPRIEVSSEAGLLEAVEELDSFGAEGVAPLVQRRAMRKLSTRNHQVGSRNAALQTRLVEEVWEQQYGVKPETSAADPVLPGQAALNNHFKSGVSLEEALVMQLRAVPGVELEVPDNPVHVFVTPLEGNSARTRITGDYVVKGYDSHQQADVEWLGTKFMQLSGEITPDIHRASLPLREQIMAVDAEFKIANYYETTLNPRRYEFDQPFCFSKEIEVTEPKHCLVMPKVFGSNVGNIVEEPRMRASFAKAIEGHTQEMARMAFKDLVTGNSDRVIRMYPGLDSPPYLPPDEEVATGSPMNSGNIMFQTIEGEVIAGTGFAIDNYGHTVNRLGEEEGRNKELRAFEFYMEDVGRSIKGGGEVGSAPHCIVNQIMMSLKGALDSKELVLGAKAEPLYTMPDADLRAMVIQGLKQGWQEVVGNKAALKAFLESTAEEDAMETPEGELYRSIFLQKVEIVDRVHQSAGI